MGYFKKLFTDQLPLWAEGCGTFLLVLIGTSVLTALGVAGQATSGSAMLLATLGFGLTLGCLVWLFGPISGGHFNPAVSTLELLRQRIGWSQWFQYVLIQFAGAILASIVVALLYGTPGVEAGLGVPSPMTVMGPLAAITAELFGTAVLLMAVVAATKSDVSRSASAIMVGLALSLGMLMALGISGGALNPARALGPQLVAANMTYWWVYLLGPLAAAILVGGLTRLMHISLTMPAPVQSQPVSTSISTQPDGIIPDLDLADDNLELQSKAAAAAEQLRVQQHIDQAVVLDDIVEPSTTTTQPVFPNTDRPLQPSFGGLVEDDEPAPITYAEIVDQTDVRTEDDAPQPIANLSFTPKATSTLRPDAQPTPASNGALKVKFVDFDPADDSSND